MIKIVTEDILVFSTENNNNNNNHSNNNSNTVIMRYLLQNSIHQLMKSYVPLGWMYK